MDTYCKGGVWIPTSGRSIEERFEPGRRQEGDDVQIHANFPHEQDQQNCLVEGRWDMSR